MPARNGHNPEHRSSTQALHSAIFAEATSLLEAEFQRPLTVEEVASRVATSPRQLRRAFSGIGETSFRSFLVSVRMSHAADLLATTDLPIREVGLRVGYRQGSQFTKAFKRAHDATPSDFRAGSNRPTYGRRAFDASPRGSEAAWHALTSTNGR